MLSGTSGPAVSAKALIKSYDGYFWDFASAE